MEWLDALKADGDTLITSQVSTDAESGASRKVCPVFYILASVFLRRFRRVIGSGVRLASWSGNSTISRIILT